ncbi:hypothetical protein [Actinomadura alba]|uniref:hypothetical protein n=1 Tax=Actinomadura alba TaxID=406431 RepID=UPI001C9BD9B4|nr:hypothetical protein [Actinomadura alba]
MLRHELADQVHHTLGDVLGTGYGPVPEDLGVLPGAFAAQDAVRVEGDRCAFVALAEDLRRPLPLKRYLLLSTFGHLAILAATAPWLSHGRQAPLVVCFQQTDPIAFSGWYWVEAENGRVHSSKIAASGTSTPRAMQTSSWPKGFRPVLAPKPGSED